MMILSKSRIRAYERGFLFRDGALARILEPGDHWLFDLGDRYRLEVVSVQEPWLFLTPEDLLVVVRSGLLGDEALVVDLAHNERAVVAVDGRYEAVLGPGLYVLWTVLHRIEVTRADARELWLEHPDVMAITALPAASAWLSRVDVALESTALVFRDGRLERRLGSGTYAFWKGAAEVVVVPLDLREQTLELAGQEILTADKVSLRLNSLVTYRVTDPERAVAITEDVGRALYRQAQLALRAVVGTAELDRLLAAKDEVAAELLAEVRQSSAPLGVEILAFGIKDLILPGEMKELMNRVTEAKKAAEAAVVTRREETAAMRSQANTARLLADNPTLMRMRELEVLEKVAERANLTVMLGDGDLSDRVVKML